MISNEDIFQYNESRDKLVRSLSMKELHKNFNRIIVVCADSIDSAIEAPINLVRYSFVSKALLKISSQFIFEQFGIYPSNSGKNPSYDSLIDNELVIWMPHLNTFAVNALLLQFRSPVSFHDFIICKITGTALNYSYDTTMAQQHRIRILKMCDENMYWTLKTNCNMNITSLFASRMFRTSYLNIESTPNVETGVASEQADYLKDLHKTNRFVNPSSVNEEGFIHYYLPESVSYTTDDLIHIYDLCSEIEKRYFVFTMLCSKNLCHLVLKAKFMTHVKSMITKYMTLFMYCLKYAWLSMYIEESLKYKSMNVDDRFVFSCEDVINLPADIINVKDCAYLPLLIDSKTLNFSKNFIPDNIENKNLKLNCCSTEQLVERIRDFVWEPMIATFVSPNDLINVIGSSLHNGWEHVGICGSIMAACLPSHNVIKPSNDGHSGENFRKFVKTYYGDSDTDMAINLVGPEFIEKVNSIKDNFQTLFDNIQSTNDTNSTNNKLIFRADLTVQVFINKTFIDEHAPGLTESEMETEINSGNKRFESIIYKHYLEKCMEKVNDDLENGINITNDIYEPRYRIVPLSSLSIKYSGFSTAEPIQISENLKYKLSHPFLRTPFEIFSVRKNIIKTVANFHVPIVRSYFNGTRAYILPSCVSALKTKINIDIKYFSSGKFPGHTIIKYLNRGFGTVLNKKEINEIMDYRSNNKCEKFTVFKDNKSRNFSNSYVIGKHVKLLTSLTYTNGNIKPLNENTVNNELMNE